MEGWEEEWARESRRERACKDLCRKFWYPKSKVEVREWAVRFHVREKDDKKRAALAQKLRAALPKTVRVTVFYYPPWWRRVFRRRRRFR